MWNILEILFSSQNPNFQLQYICNLLTHSSNKSLKGKYYLTKFKKGKSKKCSFILSFLKIILINTKKSKEDKWQRKNFQYQKIQFSGLRYLMIITSFNHGCLDFFTPFDLKRVPFQMVRKQHYRDREGGIKSFDVIFKPGSLINIKYLMRVKNQLNKSQMAQEPSFIMTDILLKKYQGKRLHFIVREFCFELFQIS